MSVELQDIAAELRAEKARSRLTLAELTERTGFSPFKLNQIFNGAPSTKIADVQRLFEAMGCDVTLHVERAHQAVAA